MSIQHLDDHYNSHQFTYLHVSHILSEIIVGRSHHSRPRDRRGWSNIVPTSSAPELELWVLDRRESEVGGARVRWGCGYGGRMGHSLGILNEEAKMTGSFYGWRTNVGGSRTYICLIEGNPHQTKLP